MKIITPITPDIITADGLSYRDPVGVYEGISRKDISQQGMILQTPASSGFSSMDLADWLPYAASAYRCSPDIKDYVLVPVVAMPSDLPNRNGMGFPLMELRAWSTDAGMIAYQTFKGKPVFVEHKNSDPTKAIGVIADTSLTVIRGFGDGKLWKLLLLLAIDRTKDLSTAGRVLKREVNTYSMGAYVAGYSCGYCGAPLGSCVHVAKHKQKEFYILNGRLVYKRVHGIRGFETSVVTDPAYVSAISDKFLMI